MMSERLTQNSPLKVDVPNYFSSLVRSQENEPATKEEKIRHVFGHVLTMLSGPVELACLLGTEIDKDEVKRQLKELLVLTLQNYAEDGERVVRSMYQDRQRVMSNFFDLIEFSAEEFEKMLVHNDK